MPVLPGPYMLCALIYRVHMQAPRYVIPEGVIITGGLWHERQRSEHGETSAPRRTSHALAELV